MYVRKINLYPKWKNWIKVFLEKGSSLLEKGNFVRQKGIWTIQKGREVWILLIGIYFDTFYSSWEIFFLKKRALLTKRPIRGRCIFLK